MSKPLATKVSTPLNENVQIGPQVSIFCVATIIFVGMEYTRASHVATGVLYHSSMTTSQSWWMLETLPSSTFRLRMPHRCSIGVMSGDMLGQSITFTSPFTFLKFSPYNWVRSPPLSSLRSLETWQEVAGFQLICRHRLIVKLVLWMFPV